MKLQIITGLSGSGKTTALKIYEDLGYYSMDNVPVYLIEKFIELNKSQEHPIEKMAVVVDFRSLEIDSNLEKSSLNLAIIIMNLMENSIDIIRNNDFSEKDKKIFLSVKFIGETLLIKIKSPYKNIKIRDDIKEDSVFDYTVFLNKVKSIVDNYESDIKVKTRDIIEIYVLIYLNNKNS